MLAESILHVLEPKVASVGHLRPELLPVRGSPFWKFTGKFLSSNAFHFCLPGQEHLEQSRAGRRRRPLRSKVAARQHAVLIPTSKKTCILYTFLYYKIIVVDLIQVRDACIFYLRASE